MKKVLFALTIAVLMLPMIANAQTKATNHQFVTESACNSFTWDLNGETYTSDTVVVLISGDTLYVLDLAIHYDGTYSDTKEAGCYYTWGGETYSESGSYTHTFTDKYGCDSTVTLALTIEDTNRESIDTTVCKRFTWRGKTFTADTVCYDTVDANPTANVCASIHGLTLHITTPTIGTTSDTTVSGCGFVTFGSGSNRFTVYETKDTSRVTTVTTDGQCTDNVLNIHLVVNNSKYVSKDTTSCGTFVWGSYSATESKTDTIKVGRTTVGCDSLVVLHLVVYEDISLTINGDLYLQPGESTTLTAVYDKPATIEWNYNGQTSSDSTITLTNLQENTDVSLSATTANGCSRTAYVTVVVSPNASIEDAQTSNVNIYPNPAADMLNIESDKTISMVEVIDITGRKISEMSNNSEQTILNMSSFQNGIYILSIRFADGSSLNRKVAVKR